MNSPQQSGYRLRVFFDIDGTVLLTGGAGRTALEAALVSVFGTEVMRDGYRFHFHGKTDPQIALQLLTQAGFDRDEIRRDLPSVWPVYLERLRQELELRRGEGSIRLLPGVSKLLRALEGTEGVVLGLLTGNIEAAAWLKLEAAGVTTQFAVGAFGSDAEARTEIAQVADDRSRALLGSASPAVVVGDTPADVACARVMNGYAVAVATGRHSASELSEAGADAVFEDFTDTQAVLDTIMAVAGPGRRSTAAAADGGRG